MTGKVNDEVIVNGHSDSSNADNDNKKEPSTDNVKIEDINQNESVLTEKGESVSMKTEESNISKNGSKEEIREDVITKGPDTDDNETNAKTAAETKQNENHDTSENLITEEDKANTLQEIDLENKNENKNVEKIVSEAKTVEITKTVQETKALVENDVVLQKEIYEPKPVLLSVEGKFVKEHCSYTLKSHLIYIYTLILVTPDQLNIYLKVNVICWTHISEFYTNKITGT